MQTSAEMLLRVRRGGRKSHTRRTHHGPSFESSFSLTGSEQACTSLTHDPCGSSACCNITGIRKHPHTVPFF